MIGRKNHMRRPFYILLGVFASVLWSGRLAADDLPAGEYSCTFCHGKNGTLAEVEENRHLIVTPEDLAFDVHWQAGLRCHDCHGGNPRTEEYVDHRKDDGFRTVESPADIARLCSRCHGNAEYMKKFDAEATLVTADSFLGSAHGHYVPEGPDDKAVTCNSCHPVHRILDIDDRLAAVHTSNLTETCGSCHEEQLNLLRGDVHGRPGLPKPVGCIDCHMGDVHGMLAIDDPHSPVFVNKQVETCGACHEQAYQEYRASVHGQGLERSGLLTTAVCSSCHGAHGVYATKDERSPLHVTRVDATCAECHRFIQERLAQSVHGRGGGPGNHAEETSPGGDSDRNPTCTDCHVGHDQPHPRSARFRLESSRHCGHCHEELAHGYAMSLHGQLTDLGYGPAAKCSDCHGSHDILPVDDPKSRVAPENRVATCRSCHPHTVPNFVNYKVHADHHDGQRYPFLHIVFLAMECLLYSTFGFFAIHTLLWFIRSLIDVIRHGRPRRLVPECEAIIRFEPIHRATHLVVIISFLGLAVTGLPIKYSEYQWAQTLAYWLGGFASTGLWHHIFGVVTVGYLVIHVVWLVVMSFRQIRRGANVFGLILGPDSPVPNPRDLRDMVAMFRWFFRLGPKPTFERWTYWEKFDYWAVFWGVGIIGTSGFMLWMPNLFCRVLPGEVLNVAKIVHSEEALLATGFIFAIHFFNTHFRPEKFPMDMCVLSGLVTDEEMREERPEYYERLRSEGKLDALRTHVPTNSALWLIGFGGLVALIIGLGLLAGMIWALVSHWT